jgi:septum formation protein
MIILASSSPRRRELLQQIGCDFRVVESGAEEAAAAATPQGLVLENAFRKAAAAARQSGAIPVLGADTVVSRDGSIYGKPKDSEEAKEMLARLAGKWHEVSTGVVFFWQGRSYRTVLTTKVLMAPLSGQEIARYVATGEPLDKAGAYGIQGRAAAFIEKIEGSYSNVVGLPLHAVVRLAGEAGIDLYGDGKGSST